MSDIDNSVAKGFRILSHFWLEEVKAGDRDTIAALPLLAQTLPAVDESTLTNLAVEYQRLFGFNLPPYESVFIDPSGMLMAPATERIQSLYRQQQWEPPAESRTGAPDHLGLELLALADGLELGKAGLANSLQRQHLALWVPPFVLALRRLEPHPFYATLADLTLELILATLPGKPFPAEHDPFPILPPPPVYRGSDDLLYTLENSEVPRSADRDVRDEGLLAAGEVATAQDVRLRHIIKPLLSPCETGLFLTREDIARIGQALNSPGVMGERHRMLDTLFRFAGQYDLVTLLFDQLIRVLSETDNAYLQIIDEYPAWTVYGQGWRRRLADTQTKIDELRNLTTSEI